MIASMNLRVGLIGLLVAALHVALIAAVTRFEPRHPPSPEALAIALLVAQPPPAPPEVVTAPALPESPPPAAPAASVPAPILPPPSQAVPPPPAAAPPPPTPPPPRQARPVPPPPAPTVAAKPPPATPAPPTAASQPVEQVRAAPSAPELVVSAEKASASSTPPTVTRSEPPASEPAQSATVTATKASQTAAPDTPKAPPSSGTASGARRSTGPRLDASWSGNQQPEWTCPQAARLRRLDKLEAKLSVHIDEQGRVAEALVSVSSGFTRFDAFAVETVKKWRFTPTIVDGRPTAEWYHDWAWSVPCEY